MNKQDNRLSFGSRYEFTPYEKMIRTVFYDGQRIGESGESDNANNFFNPSNYCYWFKDVAGVSKLIKSKDFDDVKVWILDNIDQIKA